MQTPMGHELQYTFVQDFQIASAFGEKAVKDTYKRVWAEWKDDYKALTEIVIATNWECWRQYELGNMKLSELYSDLYYKSKKYAETHLKGEEFSYYFEMTD